MKYLIRSSVLVSLVLTGFGCKSPFSQKETITTTSVATSTTPIAPTSTQVSIDETWDTYTSKSGFSFRYPTKGRLAPQWFIENYQKNDKAISEGCYVEGGSPRNEQSTTSQKVIGSTSFCVTRTVDPGAGQRYYNDSYTFENGSYYTVITFTKHFVNGDMLDKQEFHGKTAISVGNSYEVLDEEVYIRLLDAAVQSFKKE